tara:strand:+ start:9271 stop:9414 length:144 start_codon:yes stop_codon:yes gene_type:complete
LDIYEIFKIGDIMDKIKDMWNSLSEKGKMFAYGVGAILILIIISYII